MDDYRWDDDEDFWDDDEDFWDDDEDFWDDDEDFWGDDEDDNDWCVDCQEDDYWECIFCPFNLVNIDNPGCDPYDI